MLAGAIIFGVEALLTNIVRPFGYRIDTIWGDMGFFVFLLSLGYVAMQRVYDQRAPPLLHRERTRHRPPVAVLHSSHLDARSSATFASPPFTNP